MPKPINLGDNYEPEKAIVRKNTATGTEEAATGLTLKFRLSATETGSAIDSTLSVNATERASTGGTYYASMTQANLSTYLTATHIKNGVFLQLINGTVIMASEWVAVKQAVTA